MFSTARFNATKLNVGASVNEVLLQTVFSEMLLSRMGVGVELHVDSLAFSSALDQQAIGASAIPGEMRLSELLRSTASSSWHSTRCLSPPSSSSRASWVVTP